MTEVQFDATFSGDGECFCWRTDFDTYKQFDRHWEQEVDYIKQQNIENGYPENQGIYDGFWQLHPDQVWRVFGVKYDHTKKYKITINIEEV